MAVSGFGTNLGELFNAKAILVKEASEIVFNH